VGFVNFGARLHAATLSAAKAVRTRIGENVMKKAGRT
jgi:hypothetical protein